MWRIDEESNQSQSQSELPEGLNSAIVSAMELVPAAVYESQEEPSLHELDLEQYLQSQRASISSQHHKAKPKTYQQRELEKQYEEGYGMGFKMLSKMGFNVGEGLGREGQGRQSIVQAQYKTVLSTRDNANEQQDDSDYLSRYMKKGRGSSDSNDEQHSQKGSQEGEQGTKEEQEQDLDQVIFDSLFVHHRSRNPQIHAFLVSLKRKFESLNIQFQILKQSSSNNDGEMQLLEGLKVQKTSELQVIADQLHGLQCIQKYVAQGSGQQNNESLAGLLKYPHLGLQYSADLLAVRDCITRINQFSFDRLLQWHSQRKNSHDEGEHSLHKQYLKLIGTQLCNLQLSLKTMYLAKESETVNSYYSELSFSIPTSSHNKNREKDAPIQISQSDEATIQRYVSLAIQHSIVRDKLEKYLMRVKDIGGCGLWILDILQTLKKHDQPSYGDNRVPLQTQSIIHRIKQEYIIPMCNRYLSSFQCPASQYPHQTVFPWLTLFHCLNSQLDLTEFLNRVFTLEGMEFSNDDLYQIVVPWLPYLSVQQRSYFENFYLAPKLLYQTERFRISTPDSEQEAIQQKKLLRGFIKYANLIRNPSLKQQVLKNGLALNLLQTYRVQLTQKPNEQTEQQLKMWVKKWGMQLDKIHQGVVKQLFVENSIAGIS